jgi:uridine kinase
MARGEYSPEGFFYDSFNYAKFVELVLDPVIRGKSSITKGIYDYRVENGINGNASTVTDDSIILFDGHFHESRRIARVLGPVDIP